MTKQITEIKPLKKMERGKEFLLEPILLIQKKFHTPEIGNFLNKDIKVFILEEILYDQKSYLENKSNLEKLYPIGAIFLEEEFYFLNKDKIIDFYLKHLKGEFYFLMLANSDQEIQEAQLGLSKIYFYSILPNYWTEKNQGNYFKLLNHCIKQIQLQVENFSLSTKVELIHQDISRIIKIGQLLSTEKDFDLIIETILKEAIAIVSADSGSIYITEEKENEVSHKNTKFLRFKKTALKMDVKEFLLPVDSSSIAGYVAMTGEPLLIEDVYSLTGEEPFSFNSDFDLQSNYVTRSMLVIPMKNQNNEVVGVIQLINKRMEPNRNLTYEEMKNGEVLSFTPDCMKKVYALAGQAAVAIENFRLIKNINNLLEGFVKASVVAIEQRDPTTSGHSFRVAEYTIALAQAVNRKQTGKYKDLFFTDEQIREIRYASLLHDFGKVGVREKVLVKEKKLYPDQLKEIRWRFRYAIRSLQYEYSQKKLDYLKKNGYSGFTEYEKFLDLEFDHKIKELKEMLNIIESCNEPTVMEKDIYGNLEKISNYFLEFHFDSYQEKVFFLKDNELVSLLVRKGNLDQNERLEIESHVSHTYRFLKQIPWTKDLKNVPEIAYGHHEKLDGSGYPLGLKEDEILPQTRMMTISDIFDALTAPDRPYKKSLTTANALDILKLEAKEKKIDEELLNIFIEAKVYEVTNPYAFRSK
ncbi:MAG: HD domain-containing phosphohydrolase [Leptonema sp. (in: bacteria)]